MAFSTVTKCARKAVKKMKQVLGLVSRVVLSKPGVADDDDDLPPRIRVPEGHAITIDNSKASNTTAKDVKSNFRSGKVVGRKGKQKTSVSRLAVAPFPYNCKDVNHLPTPHTPISNLPTAAALPPTDTPDPRIESPTSLPSPANITNLGRPRTSSAPFPGAVTHVERFMNRLNALPRVRKHSSENTPNYIIHTPFQSSSTHFLDGTGQSLNTHLIISKVATPDSTIDQADTPNIVIRMRRPEHSTALPSYFIPRHNSVSYHLLKTPLTHGLTLGWKQQASPNRVLKTAYTRGTVVTHRTKAEYVDSPNPGFIIDLQPKLERFFSGNSTSEPQGSKPSALQSPAMHEGPLRNVLRRSNSVDSNILANESFFTTPTPMTYRDTDTSVTVKHSGIPNHQLPPPFTTKDVAKVAERLSNRAKSYQNEYRNGSKRLLVNQKEKMSLRQELIVIRSKYSAVLAKLKSLEKEIVMSSIERDAREIEAITDLVDHSQLVRDLQKDVADSTAERDQALKLADRYRLRMNENQNSNFNLEYELQEAIEQFEKLSGAAEELQKAETEILELKNVILAFQKSSNVSPRLESAHTRIRRFLANAGPDASGDPKLLEAIENTDQQLTESSSNLTQALVRVSELESELRGMKANTGQQLEQENTCSAIHTASDTDGGELIERDASVTRTPVSDQNIGGGSWLRKGLDDYVSSPDKSPISSKSEDGTSPNNSPNFAKDKQGNSIFC